MNAERKLESYFKKSWNLSTSQDFLKCNFLGLKLAKIFINSDFFKNTLNKTILYSFMFALLDLLI